MELKDKVAVITGGGRGIGREIAVLFAREGANVAVSARTAAQVDEVVQTIRANGGSAIGLATDVSRQEDVDRLVARTVEEFHGIDILVNNAGVLRTSPLLAVDTDEWRQVIEINLMGTFYCAKAVAPILIDRGWGRIINMSSRSGKIGRPYCTAYCASKHGVVGFTKALAEELTAFNVTVNAICPGVVDTVMVPDTVKQGAGKIITPRQVADLALFLASDRAASINGEAVNIFGDTQVDLSM